jgi:hypothetical protein
MENEGGEPAENLVAQIARLQEQIDLLVKAQVNPWAPRYLAGGSLRDDGGRVREGLAEALRHYDFGTGYDAELGSWGREFDEKVDELTARQDAFLKYLELQASRS